MLKNTTGGTTSTYKKVGVCCTVFVCFFVCVCFCFGESSGAAIIFRGSTRALNLKSKEAPATALSLLVGDSSNVVGFGDPPRLLLKAAKQNSAFP